MNLRHGLIRGVQGIVLAALVCSRGALAADSAASAKLAQLDAENGFRDAKFGAAFASFKGLEPVGAGDAGVKYFRRPSDALQLGMLTLKEIRYGFDSSNVLRVVRLISAEDDGSRFKLKNEMWNRYGYSEQPRGWYRSVGKKVYLGFVTYGEDAGAWISPVDFWERRNEAMTIGNLNLIRSAISIHYGDMEGVYPPNLEIGNGAVMEVYLGEVLPVRATHMGIGSGTADSPEGREVLVSDAPVAGAGKGWRYSPATGRVFVNSTATDSKGVPYSSYGY